MATETLYATSLTSGAVATSANALGAPNGVFTTDTGTTSWTARFAMGNPTGAQANGTHTVTARVRKVAGQSGTPAVTSMALYDGATLIATITSGSTNVTSGTGQDVSATFAASLLSGRTLSNIEVEIVTAAAGGSPGVRTPVQLDAITWSGDFTALAKQGSASGSVAWAGSASGSVPAFPATIPGIEPETHVRMGVIQDSNGNLYRLTESDLASNNQPRMMKSTDEGLTWTEQDVTHRPGYPSTIGDLESAALTWDATAHSIVLTWAAYAPFWVEFFTSDHPTTPDLWNTAARQKLSDVNEESTPQYASHTRPTDQSYAWVFWGAASVARYRTRTAGSLGTQTDLDSTGNFPNAVLGPDGSTTHVIYKKSGQVHYKKLTSGGTLDATSTRVDSSGAADAAGHDVPFTAPVAYDAGGDTVVSVLFAKADETLVCVDIVNGTPGSEQQVSAGTVAANEGGTFSLQPICALAVDGTTLHAVWSDATTWDVYHSERPYGGSWSTPDLLVDVSTTAFTEIAWVTAAVVEHSGTRYLGYTYDLAPHADDASNITYDRVALAASGTGSATAAVAWSGTADGTRRNVSGWSDPVQATTSSGASQGSATGAHAWAGVADGSTVASGAATGAAAWAGSASGGITTRGSATGTAAWAGVASGARASTGQASGSTAWTGSADGQRASSGVADETHAWTGSVNGQRASQGSATGSTSWSGSASSGSVLQGSTSGAVAWTAVAAGSATLGGAAVGDIAWTASADGQRASSGQASSAVAWSGSASGTVAHQGSAVGTDAWVGTADGSAPVVGGASGSATGTVAWGSVATGARSSSGSTAGTFACAGTAAGSRTSQGATSGSVAWTGAASGTAPVVGSKSGSASGTTAWSGTAAGVEPDAGSATGSVAWTGTADGSFIAAGSAGGVTAWASSATGSAPVVGGNSGAATGTVGWTASASGSAALEGDATGTDAWTATASGGTALQGSASSAVVWVGSASGTEPVVGAHTGVALGAHVWSGSSSGARGSAGAGNGRATWTANADGVTSRSGAATSAYAWTGVAYGPPKIKVTKAGASAARNGTAAGVSANRSGAAVRPNTTHTETRAT